MHIKKKLFFLLLIISFFIVPLLTYAQDDVEIEDVNVTQVQKRNVRQNVKERKITNREEFKTRIAKIKDTKKQAIVEKIDNQIAVLNKKHTDRFNKLLEKLTSILSRIETKTDELETDGVNVSTVDVAVQIARDAISVAQREILDQAGKDYVIEIDTESNLREVVSSGFKEFRGDMEILRDSIKVVRDAVYEAAKTLREVVKNSNLDNGTEE